MYREQPVPDFSPHPFAVWFFIIVFGIPFVALLVWSIIKPDQSYLFGRRWMFNGEPKVSELGAFWIRLLSIIMLIITLISFIDWIVR
ncbi:MULTISPECIES: hypothetical protein [Sediminibacillus]|uniref:hypothetical protein n=1 Tax=Sediminibacillus TaxID=482460 RepID=UPI00041A299F|nr:hypothetical protein [Sediminibacillus terrae]